MNSYGVSKQDEQLNLQTAEIVRLGYTVLKNVVPSEICEEARIRLDKTYLKQIGEFGNENLLRLKENDMARSPLTYDPWFFYFLQLEIVNKFVTYFLGEYYILSLQNGIINQPGKKHHQTSWHRDLPYQNWVCSRPLAINAMICIDNFNEETGGTYVLPHSHRFESFPSPEFIRDHEICVHANSGCVILFDAMIYHRAGTNVSKNIRRGINHLFSIPLIKQQISIPRALKNAEIIPPENLKRILGYNDVEPSSVLDWRKNRLNKQEKNN
jgi:ectoine hydroxylase-related dioxygenase (phytanoyl-CoA dioxygenase family)